MVHRHSLFWRIFAVNAGLLGVVALLLLLSPVEIDAPITPVQALIIVSGLVITLIANALLLRRVVAPLARLARRMESVDLLRPGQRLPVTRSDEIGRVLYAFNGMLDRLERERQQSGRRVLAAQEAERIGVARDLHDEVGQLLTGALLQLNSVAESAPVHRREIDEARQAVRRALHDLHDPRALERNPLTRSRVVIGSNEENPAVALRLQLIAAIALLDAVPRDAKLHRAIHHTFVQPAGSQELAAEALDLPFNTYRYHLSGGIRRIVDELWRIELGAS